MRNVVLALEEGANTINGIARRIYGESAFCSDGRLLDGKKQATISRALATLQRHKIVIKIRKQFYVWDTSIKDYIEQHIANLRQSAYRLDKQLAKTNEDIKRFEHVLLKLKSQKDDEVRE